MNPSIIMKTWHTCLFSSFALLWLASSVLSNTDTCELSSNEAKKWKEFIASHPKLVATLSNVLSQELKNICEKPGVQNPSLSLVFGVERLDFTINPASSSYKPPIAKPYPVGPAPVNLDSYQVLLAYKTFVSVWRESQSWDSTVTDFDNVVLNNMVAFEGKSGIFTAPISGLYFLAYTQVKLRNLKTLEIGFQKEYYSKNTLHQNSLRIPNNLDAWGSIPVQMIIKLEKGENVSVFQTYYDNASPQSTKELEELLDKSRLFAAFLIPNTTYWTGVKPPYANAFPAFTAISKSLFNQDDKNNVDLYYDNVYEREFGTISPKTGVFTAKFRGIYYFSFSADQGYKFLTSWFDHPNSPKILVEILKNKRDIVASAFGDDTRYGQETVLPLFFHVTLLLEVGDTINAVLRYGKFRPFSPCALTGFLIVPVPTKPYAMATSYPVFNAHRSTLVGMNKTKVTFDLVTINQGGHLNGQSGVFLVPVKGHYYFSYRDTTLKSSRYTVAKLLKNGEVMATAHAHSGDGQTWMVTSLSTSAVLLLSPGDQVYVEQSGIGMGDGTTEGRSNVTIVFTGFLLNSIE